MLDKLPFAKVGEDFVVEDVLLVGSQKKTIVGRPVIQDASVTLTCEEQTLAKKVIVFKKRRRKGYKNTRGFRRRITVVRVKSIDCDVDMHEVAER